MSSLERGPNIVSSVPSKGVIYAASPRVLQAIISSDVSTRCPSQLIANYFTSLNGRSPGRYKTFVEDCDGELYVPAVSWDLRVASTMDGVKAGSELLSAVHAWSESTTFNASQEDHQTRDVSWASYQCRSLKMYHAITNHQAFRSRRSPAARGAFALSLSSKLSIPATGFGSHATIFGHTLTSIAFERL
ncbi:hypothetical protein EV421DRAFT_1910701 [Armillaria borealis]|uniref:Uncharacterized protein n=1 Tax=Armillaria borealis TaxID=47425 RepID=A0AA39MFA4_9AGAR|nr:hypothetical protein EV421DRAFT_1910701 [Armillaria borealis]